MQYQATLGFPPTGVLMEHEKVFLTASYERAVVGGPQAAQIMAASGQGTRGLLLAYRQEQLGLPAAPVAPAAPPAAPPRRCPAARAGWRRPPRRSPAAAGGRGGGGERTGGGAELHAGRRPRPRSPGSATG